MRDHRRARAGRADRRRRTCPGSSALAQPPGGRADEQPAELPGRGRGDLRAQRVEDGADRPLERLQRDVAGEAVGDDDVGGAREDVAALGVAPEVEVARGEQLVRLERELVPLLRLLADREQPHARRARCRGSPRRRPRPSSRTGAGARRGSRRSRRRRAGRDGPPCGPGSARRSPAGCTPGTRAQLEEARGEHRAGVPGGDDRVRVAVGDGLDGARRGELSGFARTASAGFSSMPIDLASSRRARGRARRGRPAEEDGLDRRRCARRARPRRCSSGPRSPPIASTAMRTMHDSTERRGEAARPRGPCTCRRSGRRGAAASAARTAGRRSRSAR